jgi:transcriptional regulator with XRE-family HTH domain
MYFARVAPSPKTFGDWLKAERERRHLTPTTLAGMAGVTPQYIYNLEKNVERNGKLPTPSPDVCMRLARALGVHYLEALRAAGHVPEDIPESEIKARMAADYVASLPDERQDEALATLKFLFEKYGDVDKMRERSPKHPAVVREGESHPPPVAETTPQMDAPPRTSRDRGEKSADPERAAKNGSEK